jgi:lipopolysaccharide heptosyltransferase I
MNRPESHATVSRILIVRLGALGDLVHAIPVAAALRRAVPFARIDWLVSAPHRELLELVPVIDRCRVVPQGGGLGHGGRLVAVLAALRRERYDVALDLQGLLKSAAMARLSGASVVVGFARPQLREPLARLFYTRTYDVGGGGVLDRLETRHVVEINLALLGSMGLETGPPEFPIRHGDTSAARWVRDRVGERYALLNPGAAWPNKRWPPVRFGALAAAIRRQHGLHSVVSWGPDERGLAEAVVGASEGAAALAPPTTVADLVAVARRAVVMVSGDTGPAHLAAAVGAPIVGLYGPTRPERNGPWAAADLTVSRATICECPHRRRCSRPSPCLLDISVEEVAAAVARRLAAEPARV